MSTSPELTNRHKRMIAFALHRLITDAYLQAEFYSRAHTGYTEDEAKIMRIKFLEDAKDAEELIGIFRKTQEKL